MNRLQLFRWGAVAGIVAMAAGCSTWDGMNHTEKDTTAVGAGGGAIAGAVVGDPVGAVVGAGVGGAAGYEVGNADTKGGSPHAQRSRGDTSFVRSVQQALNSRGYDAGPADGVWGKSTEDALRRFQASQSFEATGRLDDRTRAALGV